MLFVAVVAVCLVGPAESALTCHGAGCLNLGLLMRFTDADYNDLGDQWRAVATSSLLAAQHFNSRNATLVSAFGNLAGCGVQINVSTVDNTASDPAVLWHPLPSPIPSALTATIVTLTLP